MARPQKSKRISWAPDSSLCQVRLFLSEEAPSQSALGAQDQLQAKTSCIRHSPEVGSDDQPPPGFEGARAAAPQIPLIKWQCPPKILLNPEWQVVAGEESKEAEVQNQRQLRVLEAVYPRLSAIPPSPSVSSEVCENHHDDHCTPPIPITPIEDDDSADSSDSPAPINTASEISQLPRRPKCLPAVGAARSLPMDIEAMVEQSHGSAPALPMQAATGTALSVEPDVVAAASAAFTAIMRSSEEGSLIDRDLLIKILSNPRLLEQLVKEYGLPNDSQINPKPTQAPAAVSTPLPVQPSHFNRVESDASPSISSTGQFCSITNNAVIPLNPRPPPPPSPPPPPPPPPAPSIVQVTSMTTAKAPPVKDINYYKSLIQQHGGERQESQNQVQTGFGNRHNSGGPYLEAIHSSKQRDMRPKIAKPCVYFNSPSGCRNGANCMFLHDVSFQPRAGGGPEAPSAKRMKLEREITGRS